MFFVCGKHKVIISGQKCEWYFIYWTLLNNLWTPFYIYKYILTFKAMNNSVPWQRDLASMQNRKWRCVWSGFFSSSLEQKEHKCYEQKNTGEIWTIWNLKYIISKSSPKQCNWELIECHCRPILKLLDVFESVVAVTMKVSLFFCSNSGLNLYAIEGTNERTSKSHWKYLKMKKFYNKSSKFYKSKR